MSKKNSSKANQYAQFGPFKPNKNVITTYEGNVDPGAGARWAEVDLPIEPEDGVFHTAPRNRGSQKSIDKLRDLKRAIHTAPPPAPSTAVRKSGGRRTQKKGTAK